MCEQFEDGSSFLKADYGISCLDANRDAWVLYAVVMLIIYPIGIPMVYLFSLMRWKHKINPHTPVNGVEPDDPEYVSTWHPQFGPRIDESAAVPQLPG